MKKIKQLRPRILMCMSLASFGLILTQCKKENTDMPALESSLGLMPDGLKRAALSESGVTSSSYYLVNSLPSGYVRDGSRDYTSYVQAAVTKYSNIVFPGFPILVNDKGINIGSNKTITFEAGSEIRLKGTSKDFYNIINISNATNVTLYNPVIVGDRYQHIGTTGEHGMGIGIRGSSNITLYSPRITNCWGDGIYIGQINNSINNKNILIKDAYLRKNRRDGISIISVDGLTIDNMYAGYTDGTKPWCGINFEPNNSLCELKNIRINNPRTENNLSRGIQIGNRKMLGSSNKTTDITIVNHVDIGSKDNAFKFACNPVDVSGKMYGVINFVNPTWINTLNDVPLNLSTNQPDYKVTISSPEIQNTAGKILSWTECYTLLMKQALRAPLSVTNVLTDIVEPLEPAQNSAAFAVNTGGGSFKASNGILYSADKNFKGGSVYERLTSISNSSDDVLYQSERKGDFSYSIPLSAGTYEITFRMAEIFFKQPGSRQFSVWGENIKLISDLDIFQEAGFSKAHDIVKRITVDDGTLNLSFKASINNAKVSAFHIIKQ